MKTKFYKLHNQSLARHKVANYKELWEKLEAKGYKGFEIQVETVFTKAEKDNVYHAVFSTDSVDRHGEVVVQNWELKNFKKNPVYLDSHNYNSIEHIIGKVNKIKVADNKLEGDIEFAMSNPKGVMASEMARDGFLNASSVGFIPKEFDDKWEKILKSELLEISAVSVPANPEATYDKKQYETKDNSGEDIRVDETGEKQDEISDSEEEQQEDIKEEIADEVLETKSSPVKIVSKAIKQEYDIKSKALGRILSAIERISQETKGRQTPEEEKADINAKINKAVKKLLKLKK